MKEVLILGNGVSRKRDFYFINNWQSEIWVCNQAYQEISKLNKISRLGTQHIDQIVGCEDYMKKLKGKLIVHTRKKIINDLKKTKFKHILLKPFEGEYGFSTGISLVEQALIEKYEKVYLSGFDFGGRDLYQEGFINGTNFVSQFKFLKEKYQKFPVESIGKNITFM